MPEEAPTVRIERAGAIARITLDRPEGRNSFDLATLRAMHDAVRTVVDDPDTHALVLTGSGRYFCTGADVQEMKAHAGRAARHFDDLTLAYHGLIEEIRQADKAFVAAVNGIAAGGGVGLALSCDLVVVSTTARFVLAYANLGVSPDGGATAALVHALGPHRAREALLIDDGIGAEAAHAWGLANRIAPEGEVIAIATALAERTASRSLHTVRETKRLVGLALHSPVEAVLEAERRALIAGAGGPDLQEALEAFFAKRAPRFRSA